MKRLVHQSYSTVDSPIYPTCSPTGITSMGEMTTHGWSATSGMRSAWRCFGCGSRMIPYNVVDKKHTYSRGELSHLLGPDRCIILAETKRRRFEIWTNMNHKWWRNPATKAELMMLNRQLNNEFVDQSIPLLRRTFPSLQFKLIYLTFDADDYLMIRMLFT